jgi:hypothetical protein
MANDTGVTSPEVETTSTSESDDEEKAWDDPPLGAMIAALLAFGPILIALSRVIQVANGDTHTLLTLLETVNVIPLVTTSMLSPGGAVLVALVMFLVVFTVDRSLTFWAHIAIPAAVPIMGLLATVGINFLWISLMLGLPVAVGLPLRRAFREAPSRGMFSVTAFFVSVLVFGIYAIVGFSSSAPWLPPQVMGREEKPLETVYVLSGDDEGVTVLHRNSEVEFILRDEIKSRSFCHDARWDDAFLLTSPEPEKQTHKSGKPPCPAK